MQLKMNAVQIPETVAFNYEELKQEITEKASFYASLVFTEDQMAEAKRTKADLNKLKKALNDERLKQEREYMQPFNEFKAQINEIIKLVDEPVKAIDSQIKSFEEQQKEEKLEKIKEFWENTEHPEWLKCNDIFDQTWLNKSVSMKKIQETINEKLGQITRELETLATLPEFSFEAVECYKNTLDINKAIAEGQRLADIQKRKAEAKLAKAKEEQERVKPAPEPMTEPQQHFQPVGQWLRFEACVTVEQAMKLKEFFETNNISFRAI